MSGARLVCIVCEGPAAALTEIGLCPTCDSHPVLVAAFAEGLARIRAAMAQREEPAHGG